MFEMNVSQVMRNDVWYIMLLLYSSLVISASIIHYMTYMAYKLLRL